MALKTFMMTAAVSALISTGAIAQDTMTGGDAPVATDAPAGALAAPAFTTIGEMTVGDIIGQNAYETDGETIGEIDYIIGSQGNARAVIGIGGFLGLAEYTVALPLDDFTYDAEQRMVKVATTKDALKEQPEFDESEVESLPDDTLLSDLMASPDVPATSDPEPVTDGAVSGESDMDTDSDMDMDVETDTDIDAETGLDTESGLDTETTD